MPRAINETATVDMLKQNLTIEIGVVKQIRGNLATVEIGTPETKDCKSCGSCMDIKKPFNLLEVDAVPGLDVGCRVVVQIIRPSPYKSMTLLLLLPIVNLLAGSMIGQKITHIYPYSQNVRMLLCGFIFFALTIAVVSIYDKKIRNKKLSHRRIISIEDIHSAIV